MGKKRYVSKVAVVLGETSDNNEMKRDRGRVELRELDRQPMSVEQSMYMVLLVPVSGTASATLPL